MRTANPDQRPRVRRQRTWNVGSDPQAQFENRTGIKFLPLRPPVGPDKNVPKHSSFCAPEIPCPPKGVTHVNGVQGDANMGACAHFERPPGASLVSFWAPRKKLAARDMSRKNKNFPGGETRPSTGSGESPRCPPPSQWSGSPRHSRNSRSPGCGPGPPPAFPAGSGPPGTPC